MDTEDIQETPEVAEVVAPKKRRRRKKKVVEAAPAEPSPTPEPVAPTVAPAEKPKKVKRTRKPSSYNEFVKTSMNHPSVKDLPHRTKFAQISKLWKIEKAKNVSK